ncbi:MAG TPA: urease accessory protein UreD, partial [Streptosporangiaceae bacterium]
GDGMTRLPVLSSQAPLVLRRTADAVYLVGGAAGPLGGDDLTLDIEVRDGATLRIRTAAATIALPGNDGGESVLRVHAAVGAGGRLEYLPEPVVVADGARHRVELNVRLAAGAALLLRDEIILGRHGERGGSCVARLVTDLDGSPLLRHELAISGADEVSLGPAILAGHRAAGSLLAVDPGRQLAVDPGRGWQPSGAWNAAVMPLARHGVLVSVLADDALTLRQLLDAANLTLRRSS